LITLLLTLQIFVERAIGVVAQGVLAYFVVWWLVLLFGLDLLDLARAIAEVTYREGLSLPSSDPTELVWVWPELARSRAPIRSPCWPG
jgi:hypothetical protein